MLASFAICMETLFNTPSSINQTSYRVLLGISVLMAFLDIFNETLQLRHILEAFVYYKGPGGPEQQLNDAGYWINPAKSIIYALQTLLGDGVLVSRQ